MARDYKRDTYNGMGSGFSRAFELALTPALFGAMGYGLDRWIGIVPVFTIGFIIFALVGMFVRMWYSYDREMQAHEARGAWQPRTKVTTPTTDGGQA